MHDGKKPFFTDNCNVRDKKPISDIDMLMKNLNPFSNKLETKDGQLLNYTSGGERHCFLLHKGTVLLYRKIDGMVLNSESAPYVFGLSTQLTEPDYLFIRIHESSEVSYLPLEEANKIIERENLNYVIDGQWDYAAAVPPDHQILKQLDPGNLAKRVPITTLTNINKIILS